MEGNYEVLTHNRYLYQKKCMILRETTSSPENMFQLLDLISFNFIISSQNTRYE